MTGSGGVVCATANAERSNVNPKKTINDRRQQSAMNFLLFVVRDLLAKQHHTNAGRSPEDNPLHLKSPLPAKPARIRAPN